MKHMTLAVATGMLALSGASIVVVSHAHIAIPPSPLPKIGRERMPVPMEPKDRKLASSAMRVRNAPFFRPSPEKVIPFPKRHAEWKEKKYFR